MIVSSSGQAVFSEQTLDNIYIGLRQGAYWEQKAKEQENALKLFDSLTTGMRTRLEIAQKKEENYLMVIENQDKNMEAQKKLGTFEVKRAKKKTRKWIWIAGLGGVGLGAWLVNK